MSFTIQQFPPTRVIGLATRARGGPECAALWEKHLLPRAAEIQTPPSPLCFGIARCIPNVTDGSYEYIAAFEANPDAPLPPGMIDLTLGGVSCAVFPVPSLDDVATVWESAPAALAARPDLTPFCGPDGCACHEQPSFELYPRNYEDGQPFSIYIPLRQRR